MIMNFPKILFGYLRRIFRKITKVFDRDKYSTEEGNQNYYVDKHALSCGNIGKVALWEESNLSESISGLENLHECIRTSNHITVLGQRCSDDMKCHKEIKRKQPNRFSSVMDNEEIVKNCYEMKCKQGGEYSSIGTNEKILRCCKEMQHKETSELLSVVENKVTLRNRTEKKRKHPEELSSAVEKEKTLTKYNQTHTQPGERSSVVGNEETLTNYIQVTYKQPDELSSVTENEKMLKNCEEIKLRVPDELSSVMGNEIILKCCNGIKRKQLDKVSLVVENMETLKNCIEKKCKQSDERSSLMRNEKALKNCAEMRSKHPEEFPFVVKSEKPLANYVEMAYKQPDELSPFVENERMLQGCDEIKFRVPDKLASVMESEITFKYCNEMKRKQPEKLWSVVENEETLMNCNEMKRKLPTEESFSVVQNKRFKKEVKNVNFESNLPISDKMMTLNTAYCYQIKDNSERDITFEVVFAGRSHPEEVSITQLVTNKLIATAYPCIENGTRSRQTVNASKDYNKTVCVYVYVLQSPAAKKSSSCNAEQSLVTTKDFVTNEVQKHVCQKLSCEMISSNSRKSKELGYRNFQDVEYHGRNHFDKCSECNFGSCKKLKYRWNKKRLCNLCNQKFSTIKILRQHILREHIIDLKEPCSPSSSKKKRFKLESYTLDNAF